MSNGWQHIEMDWQTQLQISHILQWSKLRRHPTTGRTCLFQFWHFILTLWQHSQLLLKKKKNIIIIQKITWVIPLNSYTYKHHFPSVQVGPRKARMYLFWSNYCFQIMTDCCSKWIIVETESKEMKCFEVGPSEIAIFNQLRERTV